MKQILQSLKTGETTLVNLPTPIISNGHILIKTTYSLVSLGTEKMLVEFGKSSLLSKAIQQPDRVKQVLQKISTEGIIPTITNVINKLDQEIPLGYCNVGTVIGFGNGVNNFRIGDRVVSNGPHAEFVNIPQNLVAKIPSTVNDQEATFTVIGAIGLEGIRLLNPTFGETIVVFGLGLIGLMTSQMLLSNGCRVIGLDIDPLKCQLGNELGITTLNITAETDVIKMVTQFTNNIGADGVIITASAKNNDIISNAAQMCRKRGRIILVGVVGLNINRSDFYEKELSFQVSCSYGPGRYDENYEQKGNDYPLPYVRWTEKRNFESVLDAIGRKLIRVTDLISEVVELENYKEIYDSMGKSSKIASIIKYDLGSINNKTIQLSNIKITDGTKAIIGIIGAGNFTKMTLLPSLKKSKAIFKYIASKNGINSTLLAKKFGFINSTTDYNEILNDNEIDTVFIITRHDSHSRLIIESLSSGKHVFVEKPLAINHKQLSEVIHAYNIANKTSNTTITIGFNRRFSPHSVFIKNAIKNSGPINIIATMNAGFIPDNSWVQDLTIGGGRIIGEACHFIDLCSYITNSKVNSVCMNGLGINPSSNSDNASILLKYEDGSNATINYFSNGSKDYSKERLEVYSEGRTIIMDNFRKTETFGFKGSSGLKTSIDKGHDQQFIEYINLIKNGGRPLISFESIINTTLTSFAAIESLNTGKWVKIQEIC
jgi:predicted dehydrogenase/threonine dehydrogenase-like Zn-dependent dehydrogenase